MKTKEDIINFLIKKNNFKSYLEIGVQGISGNFNKVNATYKVGVDPDPKAMATYVLTSDEFFDKNTEKFDIILIDGLHEHEQVSRDIENSLKIINKGGYILMHDCNPKSEGMQQVPRIQKEWTGDTWKAFVNARIKHPELVMHVINTDYGVGIINPKPEAVFKPFLLNEDLTYKNLNKNRVEWLNLITVPHFLNLITNGFL